MKKDNQKLQVMIIGEEDDQSNALSSVLSDNFNEVEIFGVYKNSENARIALGENSPDLLFIMDNQNLGNGFETIKKLPSDLDSQVIYVSKSEKNVLSAMRLGVQDFVMSPFDLNELKSVVSNLITTNENNSVHDFAKYKNKLLINKIDKAVIIDIPNILYLEADGPYTNFIMSDNTEVKSSKSMGYYLKLLSDMPNLIRVNRSIVVNFEHIKEIAKGDNNEGTLVLSTGKCIEFSASVKNRLLQNITETLSQFFRV